jgi:hypothetical protein
LSKSHTGKEEGRGGRDGGKRERELLSEVNTRAVSGG